MIFWLFLLMLLFFFPVFLLPAAFFFFIFLFLIPLKFTFNSMHSLIHAPGELYRIAKNPILKKNHGLEHATINVLEEHYGYKQLAGYADEEGFYIIGAQDLTEVELAAREGQERLKSGETELTIHDRCGTTLTAANLLSAIIFIGILFWSGYFSIWSMLLAMLIANLIGPTVGDILQNKVTTSANVDDIYIIGADYSMSRQPFQPGNKIYVRTREV